MKQFIRRVLGFVLLIVITVLLICEIQIPDYQVIRITENTSYEKIAWNLRIINNDRSKITNSSIFIGPSWLQGGISDSMLNANGIKSLNMGVNHAGADLDYYLVSRIIKYKPKYIFLHRFPYGQGVFHPMMPLLMSPLKYFSNFKNTSSDFLFKFIPKRFYFVLKYLYDQLFDNNQLNTATKNKKFRFGWRPEGLFHINLDHNKVNELKDEKITLNARINAEIFNENNILVVKNNAIKNGWRRVYSNFFTGNGEDARSKTIALCEADNIEVAELYIPHFADACYDAKLDSNQYFFRKKGVSKPCYHLKNVSFLSNQDCWYDIDHLNTKGSCLFTDSIMQILPR
jgi:hypothetical protein